MSDNSVNDFAKRRGPFLDRMDEALGHLESAWDRYMQATNEALDYGERIGEMIRKARHQTVGLKLPAVTGPNGKADLKAAMQAVDDEMAEAGNGRG